MDPHSFFADPNPDVLLNADPDPAAFRMRIQIQPKKNYNKLLDTKLNRQKIAQNLIKNNAACPCLLNIF